MTICSLIIIIFFSVYAAQCLSTCGKLFANLFGFSYGGMMIVAAVFVLAYTFLGGYLAESASDFMQGVVMVTVLVLILILSVVSAGGLNTVIENAKSIDGFFSMVRTATPSTTEVNVLVQAVLTARCPLRPALRGVLAISVCRRCCCGSWASAPSMSWAAPAAWRSSGS